LNDGNVGRVNTITVNIWTETHIKEVTTEVADVPRILRMVKDDGVIEG